MEALTPRDLNRATLARQHLLRRTDAPAVEVVRQLVGLQAQEPASPYLALWNRIRGFQPSEVDEAFASGALLKASLLRITLHAVAADDHPWLHRAMLPSLRAARLGDRRFTESGLTVSDAEALVPHLLTFLDEPRRREEIETALGRCHQGAQHRGVWWALRTFSPIVHAPAGGPWSFTTRPAYLAAPKPGTWTLDDQEQRAALAQLVERYLAAFGPATVADIAQFVLRPRKAVREAVADLGPALRVLTGPGGVELLDVPDGALPDASTPAPPRLLGMWESTLLAYHDRSRILSETHRKIVIRRNGDVLPALLVDGYVAGVWRWVDGAVEVTAFEALPAAIREAVAHEATDLASLLADRDPTTYQRYARWWEDLPRADVLRVTAP